VPDPTSTRSWWFALTGATLGLTATGCSGYCNRPTWSQTGAFWQDADPTLKIPVDAAPWLLRPCGRQVAPLNCALIVDGERFPVEAEAVGAEACDLGYYDVSQASPTVIQTLHPDEPLPPGATAVLDCASDDEPYTSEYYTGRYGYSGYGYGDPEPLTFTVRLSQIPAAPPGALNFVAIHYTRGDENQCDPGGDYLSLQIDFDATFLREGGYIEAIYPDGQAFAIIKPTDDGTAWLPATRGPLTLTPVAIDGQRGESLVLDEDDMTEDLVYIPGCSVDPANRGPGLLALACLLAVRRRRRRPA